MVSSVILGGQRGVWHAGQRASFQKIATKVNEFAIVHGPRPCRWRSGDKAMQEQTKRTASTFAWDDPFLLESQLGEDERMIRDTARGYAQEKLLPRVIDAYLNEKTDRDIFSEMGALGLLGVTLPEQYGCAGANYVSYGLVAREIERVDSGYRSMNSVQSSLVMYPIYAYGSEAQRA